MPIGENAITSILIALICFFFVYILPRRARCECALQRSYQSVFRVSRKRLGESQTKHAGAFASQKEFLWKLKNASIKNLPIFFQLFLTAKVGFAFVRLIKTTGVIGPLASFERRMAKISLRS
ncbi:hypothetical protein Y032_0076g993 [Ancylostoma ceylanicum]|uniref:Uncharacterized protein n=1 Tax=Ancylostoma ceylanicum TaxID=53326 RepID=A0A016TUM4_9BILA|nr:hypothetical protein Y032_0076g993 [Ancylostoma ceylanicum]